jgi:uncharacterized protein (TIGR02453 family)
MSFQGFTEKTLEYFLSICLDNSKSNFEANKALYNEHVKAPLRELYSALVPVMLEIDQTICVKSSRCVSGAYNDARFAQSDPIKTYMYLHFCAETGRDTDIPGFFMDASYDGYRYGLQLYHRTTQGMTRLRDAVLENEKQFIEIITRIEADGIFQLEGDSFKKEHFPAAPPQLKNWLNRKSWWVGRTSLPDEAFFSSCFVGQLSESYFALKNLYGLLCRALKS